MTLLDVPPAAVDPADLASRPTKLARRRLSLPGQIVSTSMIILATVLLGFVGYLGLISSLHHDRAQHTAYADFRKELASATAPVGPTRLIDPDHPDRGGKLLATGTAVAILRIPEISLREVVFEGTSGLVMQKGPGHLRTTVLPGQAGVSEIMGRAAAYGGPFGKLSHLNPGDTFSVTTGQGVSNFRVLDVRRAGDPQPLPPAIGKGRLVLATADGTPFLPSGVLRVDADLVSPTLPTAATVISAANLPKSEQTLGTDSSAWIPLVLWGQALVLIAIGITWARTRWGRWQTWIVAVPALGFFGLAVADQAARLFPNLM
ncbi:MAG TPA: sortase [Jatrophihabitantaceae bacterium]|nr:sortase [Jatrophihabitantaceae bacterium]